MIGAVGVAISLYQSLYTFIVGRFIYGFSIGVLQAIAPRFLLSTVPEETTALYGPMINVIIRSGTFIGNVMALMIPVETDPDYETSNAWRIMFAFPIVF